MKVARLRKAYVAILEFVVQTVDFGCAVVCEGDLARSAWEKKPKPAPSRDGRYDSHPWRNIQPNCFRILSGFSASRNYNIIPYKNYR